MDQSIECYYDAMDAESEDEMLDGLVDAVELDPGNTDAWLVLLDSLDGLPEQEAIEAFRRLVAIAEVRLGVDAFDEFAGHFWGFHETRPYMRARAALANALHQAGRIEESCAEVESMLQLNPNDNQGLRYRQLACYLALGKLDEARGLFAKYSDEFGLNVVFAWAKVLERFLSGHEDEARSALIGARLQNPTMESYLARSRRLPKTLPASYAPGSKEEAVCFAADLRLAWDAHPEAKRWLTRICSDGN